MQCGKGCSLAAARREDNASSRYAHEVARLVRMMEIAAAMARLHEYQGKAILAANGFKIPRGRAASSTEEAVVAAKELGGKKGAEVVIKIQAWTTGRAGIGGSNQNNLAA